MFCWIRNVWDIQWIWFKVKIIEKELMKKKIIFLPCVNDQMYIQNSEFGELALGY